VLATGTDDGNVSLWNVRLGKPYGHFPLDQYQSGSGKKKRLRAHSVRALAFSPINSRLMAVAFSTGTVKLWKTSTRIFPQIIKPTNKDHKGRNRIGYPTCLEWSPNARMFAVGDSGERGGDVWIWNASGTKKHKVTDQEGASIHNITWSSDSKSVATAASDGTSNIIDAESGEVVRQIQASRSRHSAKPVFSSDGTLMAYSCRDNTLRIWDLVKCQQVSVITIPKTITHITRMKWSPDATRIALLAYESSHVSILDVKSGVIAKNLDCGFTRLYGLAWSPDSKKLYVAQGASIKRKNGIIQAWDMAASKVEFSLSDKKVGSNYGLMLTPDGKTLASSASGGMVHIWDLTEKVRTFTIPADSERLRGMAFSADGSKIATCGEDRTVKVWLTSTGKPIHGLRKHESDVFQVAFSPDGTKLASVDERYNLSVWDLATGKSIAWFRAGNWKLRWMRDSQTLAAASGSGVVFHDAANGARKGVYFHLPNKQGVLISRDGNYSGTPGVEANLIYQVLTAAGQATLSQEEFSSRFGWKNDSTKVKIIETVKPIDKSAI
ncbi:MAG: WD40 repeat domain-containing protein, partial [Phycisphaerales bacterium]|nr:WD40 repeat domain-containing protein [Phycisphaerales bacterium]